MKNIGKTIEFLLWITAFGAINVCLEWSYTPLKGLPSTIISALLTFVAYSYSCGFKTRCPHCGLYKYRRRDKTARDIQSRYQNDYGINIKANFSEHVFICEECNHSFIREEAVKWLAVSNQIGDEAAIKQYKDNSYEYSGDMQKDIESYEARIAQVNSLDSVTVHVTGTDGNRTKSIRIGSEISMEEYLLRSDPDTNDLYVLEIYQKGVKESHYIPKIVWDQAKAEMERINNENES